MSSIRHDVLVVTSAHWSGDPRLNRHVRYLTRAGIEAELVAIESRGRTRRLGAAWRAIAVIWRRRPTTVILPDPELFILGSLVGRMRGVRTVIDVHEDYQRVAIAREWIPRFLRPSVGFLARANDRIGRSLATATMVAAEELSSAGAFVVENIPDPSEFTPTTAPDDGELRVVYIGDVTEARGAFEMALLASTLPQIEVLVIGRVSDETRQRMELVAGPDSHLVIKGQIPHSAAWELADGSIAGLSLLQPLPAYRLAVATKLWEYCAAAIPPVVTDLPGQAGLVAQLDPELVCRDIGEVSRIIERLITDDELRRDIGRRARRMAEKEWAERRPDRVLYGAVRP